MIVSDRGPDVHGLQRKHRRAIRDHPALDDRREHAGRHDGRGTYSGQPDPFLGLPDSSGEADVPFLDENLKPRRVSNLAADPFVTLQWGLYLFAPSISALKTSRMGLRAITNGPFAVGRIGRPRDAGPRHRRSVGRRARGRRVNQSGATAAVYAAIRAMHGGVRRTPYGVLVASRDLVMQVLRKDSVFSVSEYQRRFGRSVGEGYLGMDSGPEYEAARSE